MKNIPLLSLKNHIPGATRYSLVCALILVCMAYSCRSRPNLAPLTTVTLAEYIEYAVGPNPEIPEPVFPGSLGIQDVVVKGKYSGSFNPDDAFKARYSEELAEAAVHYFKRKGLFTSVGRNTGDVRLLITITDFNSRKDYIPQQLNLKAESLLYLNSNNTVLMSMKHEAGVMVELKKLHETVFIPGLRGGKGLYMKQGPAQMGEITMRLFNGIYDAVVKNRENIIHTMKTQG